MSEKRDNIEIRLHEDGSVDEVVIYDPTGDRVLYHLEQMDDHFYWMRVIGITQDLVVHIGAHEGTMLWSNYRWEDSWYENEHTSAQVRTPEQERMALVQNLLSRFGIRQTLMDVFNVYAGGKRLTPHDGKLLMAIDRAVQEWTTSESDFVDKQFDEMEHDSDWL